MIPAFIDREILPHKPGVYIFKNKSGRVIYVGKAIDLYHRVASYFSAHTLGVKLGHLFELLESERPRSRRPERPQSRRPPGVQAGVQVKTILLVYKIASAETIVVESELEALILEANLIKKYLPEFNVSLKDDKDYLYIKITKEDFPEVVTARIHDLKGALKYYGPFPSSRTVRDTLKALRRVFPWCSVKSQGRKSCFYYHLGQCPGACIGEISKTDYRKNIFRLAKLLEGGKEGLVRDLMVEMEKAATAQQFEEAGRLKKMIQGIGYLTQPNRTHVYLENPNFLSDERGVALEELKRVLHLDKIPERIECYDISNIQGHESTGSMVVLTNGEIDKSQYRKFKIIITGRPNDVGMHKEMMRRRLSHPEWPLPDLILVDGGRGQVNGVKFQIDKLAKARTNSKLTNWLKPEQIPVFGLAKRMEWLYGPDGEVIKLSRRSPALKLLQKIRDEAHRFAITYHRKLHRNVILGSVSDSRI